MWQTFPHDSFDGPTKDEVQWLAYVLRVPFNALRLLAGWQEGHHATKNVLNYPSKFSFRKPGQPGVALQEKPVWHQSSYIQQSTSFVNKSYQTFIYSTHLCLVYITLLHYTMQFNSLFSKITWVSRHQKGKPLWILLEQEMLGWQWHQLDHMQIICILLQTHNHASTSPLSFYRLDALPATQLTVSKH